MNTNTYIVIPAWVVVVIVLAIIIPPSIIVSGVVTVASIVWWVMRRQRKFQRKREKALSAAMAKLTKEEALEYNNFEGRYAYSDALPPAFPFELMNEKERWRHEWLKAHSKKAPDPS